MLKGRGGVAFKRCDIGRWGTNTPHHILPDEGRKYTEEVLRDE